MATIAKSEPSKARRQELYLVFHYTWSVPSTLEIPSDTLAESWTGGGIAETHTQMGWSLSTNSSLTCGATTLALRHTITNTTQQSSPVCPYFQGWILFTVLTLMPLQGIRVSNVENAPSTLLKCFCYFSWNAVILLFQGWGNQEKVFFSDVIFILNTINVCAPLTAFPNIFCTGTIKPGTGNRDGWHPVPSRRRQVSPHTAVWLALPTTEEGILGRPQVRPGAAEQ